MEEEKTEKVISAARQVFLRYGYKRTTMADIAQAARMSRPALYLVFPRKEEVFAGVMSRVTSEMLKEIRQRLNYIDTVEGKLMYAFELWSVAPFEMTLSSPNAKDLLEGIQEVASEGMTAAYAEFEALLAQVLEPLVRAQVGVQLSSMQIARILVGAVGGFKQTAKDTTEFRHLIAGLLTITLAGLHGDETSVA